MSNMFGNQLPKCLEFREPPKQPKKHSLSFRDVVRRVSREVRSGNDERRLEKLPEDPEEEPEDISNRQMTSRQSSLSSQTSLHHNNSIHDNNAHMFSSSVAGGTGAGGFAPHMGARRRAVTINTAESKENLSLGSTPEQTPKNSFANRYTNPYNNSDRRQRITINVSGERYQTYVDTLERFPHTLLGCSENRERFYDDVEDEYFFDRDRNAFSAILYYYQSGGQLYCPLTLPLHILVTEATFFKLGTDALKQVLDIEEEETKAEMPKNKLQRKIWCLFEHPETSKAANLLTIFSVTIIVLSVTILCIETIPMLQPKGTQVTNIHDSKHQSTTEKHYYYNYANLPVKADNASGTWKIPLDNLTLIDTNSTLNFTDKVKTNNSSNTSTNARSRRSLFAETIESIMMFRGSTGDRKGRQRREIDSHVKFHNHDAAPKNNKTCICRCTCGQTNHNDTSPGSAATLENQIRSVDWANIFNNMERIFVIWFTIEFVVRAATCPNKLLFVKNYLNIIDLLAIIPYYITMAMKKQGGIGLNFRIVRLVRVFRIFKLSRHSKGLQILGLTFNASVRELGLLMFFIAMGVILFSSAVYYVENDVFSSIPDAFWWAIVTMCTVGYGDKVPHTFWGKVIGSFCAVSGVLCIALPVPVIVSNFDYFYNRERTRKMHKHVLDNAEAVEEEKEDSEAKCERDKLLNNNENSNNSNNSPTMSAKSVKSPTVSRNDEIQRQSMIKNLEKRNRKLSQRLSQTSVHSPMRKNGVLNMQSTIQERESVM